MRDSVRAAFPDFTRRFEGEVPWMYPDRKRKITCALGNLIDPIELAMPLPWRGASGNLVVPNEIAAAWHRVNNASADWARGAGHFRDICGLHLDRDGINDLVAGRLAANVITIRSQRAFTLFDQWPADAQLGILSMAWAQGPNFGAWPRFSRACADGNFNIAALECTLEDADDAAVRRRNTVNRALFRSAASVITCKGDLDALHLADIINDLTARNAL